MPTTRCDSHDGKIYKNTAKQTHDAVDRLLSTLREEWTVQTATGPPPMAPSIAAAPWEPWSGPPPGPRQPAKWTVAFTAARRDGIRQVWIHDRHLTGPGSVTASVTIGRDKRISIGPVDAQFVGARFGFGRELVYSDLAFRVRGSMQTFDPKETPALAR